jgi:hypothetical protein
MVPEHYLLADSEFVLDVRQVTRVLGRRPCNRTSTRVTLVP